MQSALQDEIDTLRRHYRSDRDPAGLVFASLADAYRRAGELDEAWSVLEEGLEEHPDFTTGHLVAARVHRDRDELDEASERYARVLELDPENTAALREKAALAQDRGSIEEALSLCQRLALLEPTDSDLRARIRDLKEIHFRTSIETDEELGFAVGTESEHEGLVAEEVEPDEEHEAGDEAEAAEDDEPAEAAEPQDEVEVADESEVDDVWGEEAWYEGLPIPESAAAEDESVDELVPEPGITGERPSPEPGEGDSEEEPRVEATEWEATEWEPTETGGGDAEPPETETGDAEIEREPAVFTRTMADLYARQGHVERALEVYDHLLERSPDDQDLRDRIRELKEQMGTPSDDGHTIASYFDELLAWEREE